MPAERQRKVQQRSEFEVPCVVLVNSSSDASHAACVWWRCLAEMLSGPALPVQQHLTHLQPWLSSTDPVPGGYRST